MIIIVGAGPAGLATAYLLQQRGLPYTVLEKHSVGWSWQNHYDRLHLHTLKEVSALPGLPMPDEYPRFPSREQHLNYLRHYAKDFALNITTEINVERALYRHQPGDWVLETNKGLVQGDVLIAASGIWSKPFRPRFDNEDHFRGEIIHASQYRNPKPFVGKRVLVVGAGNTGCELAVDLSEYGADVTILVRNGVEFVPFPSSVAVVKGAGWLLRTVPHRVGEWLLGLVRRDFSYLDLPPATEGHVNSYPVVGYALPRAVEAGRVKVMNGGIREFTADGVLFADPAETHLAFDVVILATGYRPALQFISEPDLERDLSGQPCLVNGRSTRNPNLYCVGYRYPTTEGWLQAIGREVTEITDQIAARYPVPHAAG
jgi:cation diffusion facilitator CzcD-associated flavoprotein CzcO